MRCATSLTNAVVALVPLLVKLTVSTPPVLVKVAKVCPFACRLLPLTVNRAPAPLVSNPSRSLLTAVPLRWITRLAPDQLPLPPFNALSSVSVRLALLPTSRCTVLPTLPQATLSPFRLPIVGAVLAGEVVKLRKSTFLGDPSNWSGPGTASTNLTVNEVMLCRLVLMTRLWPDLLAITSVVTLAP